MFRRSLFTLTLLAAFAVALPGWATEWHVTVQNFSFSPGTIDIQVGDTVVWTNVQGFHNVHHLGTPSLFGNAAANAPWTYTFVFNLPEGTYDYDCVIHGFQGHVIVHPLSVPESHAVGPVSQFVLAQNYPNPFNPSTTIQFTVPFDASVSLRVYNVLGQEVRQLYSGHLVAGTYNVSFDGESLPSGLYFYRLTTPTMTLVRTMQFLK
jgi:plastocyanin